YTFFSIEQTKRTPSGREDADKRRNPEQAHETQLRKPPARTLAKNALDGCPSIEKEGRFQRRKAMGRYRL
ncbi:Hypothetical predicted protein, partial [Olea europaea subsp. europaea]